MNFGRFLIIPAVFLLAVLVIQPVLSADNMTDVLTGKNIAGVTNYTADLEKDAATNNYNYGAQSLNQGDFDSAIRFFDQALLENTTMLKKTDALLYLYQNKAYALIQLERYNEAVITLDEGISSYPRDAMLWNNKGYALHRLGKTQDALAAYDNSISLDRNYTKAYINQGDVLLDMGRYSEAAAAYLEADETDPGNDAAAAGLAAARRGEAGSNQTMTIILIVVLIAAAGIAVWYIKFRKPAEPAPEETKKKRSKKK